MSDVNVVHRDPQKARGDLPNQLTDNIKRKLIGTGKRLGMSFKLACREFQNHFQLLQFELSVSQFGRVIRILVVSATVGHRGFQQIFRQNYSGTRALSVSAMIAFTDAIETVTGSNNPSVGRWTP